MVECLAAPSRGLKLLPLTIILIHCGMGKFIINVRLHYRLFASFSFFHPLWVASLQPSVNLGLFYEVSGQVSMWTSG